MARYNVMTTEQVEAFQEARDHVRTALNELHLAVLTLFQVMDEDPEQTHPAVQAIQCGEAALQDVPYMFLTPQPEWQGGNHSVYRYPHSCRQVQPDQFPRVLRCRNTTTEHLQEQHLQGKLAEATELEPKPEQDCVSCRYVQLGSGQEPCSTCNRSAGMSNNWVPADRYKLCETCGGAGIDPETELQCEQCGGAGQYVSMGGAK